MTMPNPQHPDATLLVHAAGLGIDETLVAAARARLERGDVILLAVNGKIASGKDTIAPAVMAALGAGDAAHVYFAHPLKQEVTDVVGVLRAHERPDAAIAAVADAQRIPADQAAFVAGLLWCATHDASGGGGLDGWTRTAEMRAALQYWGTEIRRRQDENYWVRKALTPALEAVAAGRSVFITDVRFGNELVAAQRAGFFAVRLDVTRATQISRLRARDGLDADLTSLDHPSETALDGYEFFDLRLDNNGPPQPTVDAICAALARRAAA